MGLNARLADQDPMFISSWKGFGNFVDALEEVGTNFFPMLLDQLPDGDEGYTSPEKAAVMLEELRLFISKQSEITQAVLVDTERNVDVSMGTSRGAMTTDRLTGYELGFDEVGFYVRDRWELNRILFRAMRIEQKLINLEQMQVEYINRDNEEERFLCNTPFGKTIAGADGTSRMFLQQFHIELRESTPYRFSYITDPLSRVLEAAIKESLSIEWI